MPIVRSLAWEMLGWYLWGIFNSIYFCFRQTLSASKILASSPGRSSYFRNDSSCVSFRSIPNRRTYFRYCFKTFADPTYLTRLAWRLMVYCIILLTWYAIDSQKRARSEEKRASELSAELSNAQLQALKMQLHPHFLI